MNIAVYSDSLDKYPTNTYALACRKYIAIDVPTICLLHCEGEHYKLMTPRVWSNCDFTGIASSVDCNEPKQKRRRLSSPDSEISMSKLDDTSTTFTSNNSTHSTNQYTNNDQPNDDDEPITFKLYTEVISTNTRH